MAKQKLEFLFHHSSSLWTSPLVLYRDFLHLGGGNTLSVIKMRLFAKTKTILHAITVLFVLPCLLTSVILTKLAPVATVWNQLIFLLLFNCVQASDHTSSAVEHPSKSSCHHNCTYSMRSPAPNRTKSPPMRQCSENMVYGSPYLRGKLLCQYITTGSKCLPMPRHYIGHKNSSCQA